MEELINTLLPFIPEGYRPKVAALIILSPYLTRAYYALISGGGLRGIISSVWLGTNVPKSHGNNDKPEDPKP